MEIVAKCETCKFWANKTKEPEPTARDTLEMVGECHRLPPVHVNNQGWCFPLIGSKNACGEWTIVVAKAEPTGAN